MNVEMLKSAGIDYDRAVKRFMGKAHIYEKVLGDFLDDTALDLAIEAYNGGDKQGLFECAHEMKGVSGNMDMTDLYRVACELVELLREGTVPNDALEAAFLSFQSAYLDAKTAIRQAMEA
ncbi:MAG: Hpt domain-containing protein [Eubacteriales bacterium]|nr:Hpt domain-containing protein [Eubacteriales bacterium]